MAEAVCPSCATRLRVPDGRSGVVTCPMHAGGCGTKFRFPHIERSDIAFRCACDGAHFTVGFQRKHNQTKFTVDRIVPATIGGGKGESAKQASYNADIYDFRNFYCGCCGYSPNDNAPQFVRCGKCRQIVCGAQVYKKLDGPTSTVYWFICYPECGHEGPITGRIEEYDASRGHAVERVASALVEGKPVPLKIR